MTAAQPFGSCQGFFSGAGFGGAGTAVSVVFGSVEAIRIP
jgi:hypothetical protein